MDKVFLIMKYVGADNTNGGYMVDLDEVYCAFHTKEEAENFIKKQQERIEFLRSNEEIRYVTGELYIKEVGVPSEPLVWEEHIDQERKSVWFSYSK